jgi:glycosyltransferase involved in cell wall biosynthesis
MAETPFALPKGIEFGPWMNVRDQLPRAGSVPVTIITLTKDEAPNIARCIASTMWADQHVVVDAGSHDGTTEIAAASGAEVHFHEWTTFGAQRQYALTIPTIRNDWVYFVDADEWTSAELAEEIASRIASPDVDAYTHRLRLVFGNVWMKHGGFYQGSWVVRLVRRSHASFDEDARFAERVQVEGRRVGRLQNDIVDHDQKGIYTWIVKHARYAKLQAEIDAESAGQAVRPAGMMRGRWLLRTYVVPRVPLRPFVRFVYMYLLRAGFLHGRMGFRFAALHACFDYQSIVIGRFRDENLP